MKVKDLVNVHVDDLTLWLHVHEATWRLVEAAKIKLNYVRPTPRNLIKLTPDDSVLFGRCHYEDKVPVGIEVTMRAFIRSTKKWNANRVKFYELFDTICHELAHAKAGWDADHDGKFAVEYAKLILLAEKIKIRRDILASGARFPV